MTEISFRRLEYFLVVAEELSFTRAARRLQMAQPPLSQQIQKLEREMQCRLFERSPRGIQLTAAGIALTQEASALLADADRVAPRVRAAGSGDAGYLVVGCVPVACATIVSLLVREFHRVHPDVHVEIREMDNFPLYTCLDQGTVDVAIVRTGGDSSRLETMDLLEEAPLLALPDDHSLTARRTVRLSDLRNEDFVLYSRRLGTRHFDEFTTACRDVGGFSPRIVSECESVSTQLAMVGAGLGLGFVTELSAVLRTPGVAYRKIEDLDLTLPLIVAWSTQRANPVRARFTEVAATWSRSMRAADRPQPVVKM